MKTNKFSSFLLRNRTSIVMIQNFTNKNRKTIICVVDIILLTTILICFLFFASVRSESLPISYLFIAIAIFIISVLSARSLGTFNRISKLSDKHFPDTKRKLFD